MGKSFWACNGQWCFPPGKELGVKHEERDSTEVVGMEVGDENCPYGIEINLPGFQCCERGGPAVDEKIDLFTGNVETGVESSAAAESVPASYEMNAYFCFLSGLLKVIFFNGPLQGPQGIHGNALVHPAAICKTRPARW